MQPAAPAAAACSLRPPRLQDFLFKKELWTSILIARHLPWDLAGVWLDDCTPQTPTLIAVGSTDAIVDPSRVAAGFGSWQVRLWGVKKGP